jgi:type IV secretion system protein VirB10
MAIKENDLHGPTHLDLDPKPPNAVRLSKRAGILGLAILGVVGLLLFYGIATRSDRQFKLGFQPADGRNVTAATDVGKTIASRVPARSAGEVREQSATLEKPEELTAAPLTYRPARPQPSVVTATRPPTVYPAAPPATPQQSPEDRRRELALQRELEAMDAPTAAREAASRTGGTAGSLPTAQSDMAQMTQLLQALQGPGARSLAARAANAQGGVPRISIGGQSVSAAEEYKLQNAQDEKEEFLGRAKARNQETYLNRTRVKALGPYEIKAGWDIPAVLEQALNSDLPGEIKALVRENVYDTATGKHLLIPQGSRLVGNYSSRISYGQNGIQVTWDRIIFSDASSIVLEGMPGQDAKGMTGLRDKVDNHYGRLFGMGALTSLFAAAGQLTVNRRNNVFAVPSPQELAGQAAAQNMAQIGAEATRRNLYIQPTIKVDIGYRFNVRVNRDLLFDAPYRPFARN